MCGFVLCVYCVFAVGFAGEGTIVLEDSGVASPAEWRKARRQYYQDLETEELAAAEG